ncbi:hypothetical protein SLEP1_g38305 [Rubroshorea leprosula]|uniref:Uncharacterized protein n=1 Tax=Rubroshorea leprosula TaxID=152421 RepID=A0AAV5KXS0_9ROSI|nr:hypothetical protein SLEP1_g38305 [Rubroshorea leprosula]
MRRFLIVGIGWDCSVFFGISSFNFMAVSTFNKGSLKWYDSIPLSLRVGNTNFKRGNGKYNYYEVGVRYAKGKYCKRRQSPYLSIVIIDEVGYSHDS